MTETTFVANEELTQQFKVKASSDCPGLVIGSLLSDTMFHVDFRAKVDGEDRTLRLYKHLGERDRLDVKLRNILSEENIVRKLHEAGVYVTLRDRTGCLIPNILAVGPRKDGEVEFWKEPIAYMSQERIQYNLVGFQLSDPTLGIPLSTITDEAKRQNPAFLQNIGTQFGNILAEFHYAAREVDLPRYESEDDLRTRDHGYRYAVAKTKQVGDDEAVDESYRGLAKTLLADFEPEFAAEGKREQRVHGNMAMEMLMVAEEQVVGLVNFAYARNSFPETDFRALALLPEALDASIAAYETRMKELTGQNTKLDKALALKLSLAIHASSVYLPKFSRGAPLDPADPKGGQIAQEIVASSIILDQLAKLDSKYEPYAEAFRSDAVRYKARYLGIENKVI